MTESGRNCFLNSICYIKKFDGQPPLVRKTSQGRRWALVYAGIELLERGITMLEKEDQAELAGRILKRYTMEDFSQPGQWRAWLEENHHRLFFTDTGGYKFMVIRPADEPAGKSTTQKGVR